MLLSIGQFMTQKRKKAESTTIDGLLIDFNYTINWIGPAKIAIYGGTTDAVKSMSGSEPFNAIIASFDDLTVGELNTDSDYNSNIIHWTQIWPGISQPHWSDSKTSNLKAWFKFSFPISSLTKILIRLRRPDIYGLPPDPLFSDITGNFYIPISAPSNLNDYIEIIGSDRTYEYLF